MSSTRKARQRRKTATFSSRAAADAVVVAVAVVVVDAVDAVDAAAAAAAASAGVSPGAVAGPGAKQNHLTHRSDPIVVMAGFDIVDPAKHCVAMISSPVCDVMPARADDDAFPPEDTRSSPALKRIADPVTLPCIGV